MRKLTDTDIYEYLFILEHRLLVESVRHTIELTHNWANSFPNESAVYLFSEDGEVCYVGETGSLKGQMSYIFNTKNHTLRRNLGSRHFIML